MNFSKKKKKEEPKGEEDVPIMVNMGTTEEPKLRLCGIYGDINEERSADVIYNMYALRELGRRLEPSEEAEDGVREFCEPFRFIVATHGGSATDMFAIYDSMREIKQECEIHTVGQGKVMSAGVLLLAAGTKGERRIGKHCRIMIHGVVSGQQGYIQDVENEFEEAKITQKMYVKSLSSETDMTEKYIKNLLDRKTNVYFNAEQAVEMGIADIII
jgi:ATP-dependent Clp endopeptidase proteolytic subunit ClpP